MFMIRTIIMVKAHQVWRRRPEEVRRDIVTGMKIATEENCQKMTARITIVTRMTRS